jgi:extracellular elastinolytic metalloproteinase
VFPFNANNGNTDNPDRDADFQNDIIIHEFAHGVTNRLTGGGVANCLQTTESAGLGEGWSDAMAEWALLKRSPVPDFILGTYAQADPKGIRTAPYSTDHSVNPLTYQDLQERTEVHEIGEVWAVTLHGILSALVDKFGYSETAKTNPDGPEGNVVWFHIFIDALSIQPCNPTFIQARDAWLQADVNRYDGVNECLLWKAFADRGLGTRAANFVNSMEMPFYCN